MQTDLSKKYDIEPITIEQTHLGFIVRQGDRYGDCLCFDEMMGLVAHLTKPDSVPYENWMKTEEQWEEYYKSRNIHNFYKKKETLLLEMKN